MVHHSADGALIAGWNGTVQEGASGWEGTLPPETTS